MSKLPNFQLPSIDWISATAPENGNLFSFSEFLATFSLLLIVITVADFRYKFRLAVAPFNIKKIAFGGSFLIGVLILLVDFWFQNEMPIPKFLNYFNQIKLVISLLFVSGVFAVVYFALRRPQKFRRSNAVRYTSYVFELIAEANKEHMAVLAKEMGYTLPEIFSLASKVKRGNEAEALVVLDEPNNQPVKTVSKNIAKQNKTYGAANDLLLAMGDPRFCKVVASQNPWFAVDYFNCRKKYAANKLPSTPFAVNIGGAFLRDKESVIFQETEGYSTGLIGYVKPISSSLFLYDADLERYGDHPLDINYFELTDIDGEKAQAFVRLALIFAKSYFDKTQGNRHSYVWSRSLSAIKSLSHSIYKIEKIGDDYWRSPEYESFEAAADYVKEIIKILDECDVQPINRGRPDIAGLCPYDRVAELFLELIFNASSVSGPEFKTWSVQHNSLWSAVFRSQDGKAIKIIRRKICRILYSEITEMDKWANFKGGRVLGYCLNILGIKLRDKKGYGKEFYPLQKVVLDWTVKNYAKLLEEHPNVAQVCLHGKIGYDEKSHSLTETYKNDIGKYPKIYTLKLDDYKKPKLA